MSDDQVSQEEKIARRKMAEARKLFEKRPEQGVEAMHELLEMYPDFIDARQWLADHYEETEQTRKAVTQYEEMLRQDPENDEIWEGLQRVDPVTAERLQRFRHVAPDPFMKGERDTSDFDDLDDMEYEDEMDESDSSDEEKGAPFRATPADDDLLLDDDEEEDFGYEMPAWAHEQDAEYRQQLDANRNFCDVLDGFDLFWQDPQGWSHLLGECRAPGDADWVQLEDLTPAATSSLHVGPPTVLVFPDHTRMPLALPLTNPSLVIGETYRMALTDQEMLFALGFGIHGLIGQNAEYIWAAEHVAEHSIEDCEIRLRVLRGAADFTVGWNEGLPREETIRIAKLCHAWELRAVLSADRAGLVACGSVDASCRALAAMIGDPGDAPTVSVDGFLEQFEAVPVGELASIPLNHDPWTDARYAAYRIQMLKWWATTDDYQSLK